jgi:hypothetical protein
MPVTPPLFEVPPLQSLQQVCSAINILQKQLRTGLFWPPASIESQQTQQQKKRRTRWCSAVVGCAALAGANWDAEMHKKPAVVLCRCQGPCSMPR